MVSYIFSARIFLIVIKIVIFIFKSCPFDDVKEFVKIYVNKEYFE